MVFDDNVTFERYDKDGLHHLKSEGKQNEMTEEENLYPNTTIYNSPVSVKLTNISDSTPISETLTIRSVDNSVYKTGAFPIVDKDIEYISNNSNSSSNTSNSNSSNNINNSNSGKNPSANSGNRVPNPQTNNSVTSNSNSSYTEIFTENDIENSENEISSSNNNSVSVGSKHKIKINWILIAIIAVLAIAALLSLLIVLDKMSRNKKDN